MTIIVIMAVGIEDESKKNIYETGKGILRKLL
jgi:hypothetical protein